MARRPLIGANWKLHLGPDGAVALARRLHADLLDVEDVDVVLFPTALSVPAVVEALRTSRVAVGVQWVSPHASGAYTGANSATLAREVGCTWALSGHSEARRDLGDTDERVGAAVRASLTAGLLPMVCVGESLAERDAGQVELVLERQLDAALRGLHADQVATCTLAYEPVWAIGTGRHATPEQAQTAHAFVRGWLAARYPAFVAEQVRVLYGGSVKPDNARTLLSQPDVDGALVGGASLDADQLLGIVAAARP
jgi:triosephosphate isomerase